MYAIYGIVYGLAYRVMHRCTFLYTGVGVGLACPILAVSNFVA